MSDAKPEQYYTVVFKGDVRSIRENLFRFVSPFGEVIAIGVGDAFERIEQLELAEEMMHEAGNE